MVKNRKQFHSAERSIINLSYLIDAYLDLELEIHFGGRRLSKLQDNHSVTRFTRAKIRLYFYKRWNDENCKLLKGVLLACYSTFMQLNEKS